MFDIQLNATRRVGYTPATGRILLRRRFDGLFRNQASTTLSTTGARMTSTIVTAPANMKLTGFELLMLAPFGLLLWYVGTQPLVLPAAATTVAAVPVVASAVVADQTLMAAPADPDAPAFVTANTTVLQRIAPVARLTLEPQEVPAVSQGPEQVHTLAVSPAAAAEPIAVEAPPVAQLRIEIADSSGVKGLARDIASELEKSGVTVSKTANMSTGAQRRTVILYREGFEGDAYRLSKLFAHPPAVVVTKRPRNDADASEIRLVLGTAAAREKRLLAARATTSGM